MKLTLNRREGQEKGFFKTSTVYYLDINLEATPEEMALIKKHNWNAVPLCAFVSRSRGPEMTWSVGEVVGQPKHWGFNNVEELAYVESQVIENAKKLKQQLEAAARFTSGGPREVEL